MSDLPAIRERHRAFLTAVDGEFCSEDDQRWPCDTAQLLAVVDGLRAALELIAAEGNPDDGAAIVVKRRNIARAALADTGTPVR